MATPQKLGENRNNGDTRYKSTDFIFYLIDEKGELKVITTIDRPLTAAEFLMVEQNINAYREATTRR